MTREEVLTRLCYYDLRNPDGALDQEDVIDHHVNLIRTKQKCSCDNCFYGRTRLAEYILTLLEKQ